jgi:hypothetical protein
MYRSTDSMVRNLAKTLIDMTFTSTKDSLDVRIWALIVENGCLWKGVDDQGCRAGASVRVEGRTSPKTEPCREFTMSLQQDTAWQGFCDTAISDLRYPTVLFSCVIEKPEGAHEGLRNCRWIL